LALWLRNLVKKLNDSLIKVDWTKINYLAAARYFLRI